MKLQLRARVFKASITSEQEVEGSFSIGQINFDNRRGLGSVPDCSNIVYMGMVALMYPSKFLLLAADGKEDSKIEGLKAEILKGTALGSPFLTLDDDKWDEIGMLRCVGHEGRHRCYAIKAIQDEPIPVCIFLRGGKARDITPEMVASLNRGIQCQLSSYVAQNTIEELWLAEKHYRKTELG